MLFSHGNNDLDGIYAWWHLFHMAYVWFVDHCTNPILSVLKSQIFSIFIDRCYAIKKIDIGKLVRFNFFFWSNQFWCSKSITEKEVLEMIASDTSLLHITCFFFFVLVFFWCRWLILILEWKLLWTRLNDHYYQLQSFSQLLFFDILYLSAT